MTNLPYISPELVTNYKTQIETSASPATAKRKVASLKKFFNWAHEAGHIENNPMPKTTSEKITPNELKTIIKVPISKKPAKYLNVTNLIRVLFGVGIVLTTFAILTMLKVPIPFIPSPASDNLVTISDPNDREEVPASQLPSSTPVLSPSPVPTSTPLATTTETQVDDSLTEPSGSGLSSGSDPSGFGGLLEADLISLFTSDLSDGDITLNPDGSGNLNLIFEGSAGNQINATAANLNSGSLYYGYVGNNSTSYNLLLLQNGSNQTTRFSVDALGNTRVAGNLSEVHDVNLMGNLLVNGKILLTQSGKLNFITGYYQESGLFDINQGAPDYGLIHKTLTDQTGKATREVLKIELDESSLTDLSSEDALIVSRKSGKSDAYAIYVPFGNIKFDNDLGIGKNIHAGNNLSVNHTLTVGNQTNNGNLVLLGSRNTDYLATFTNRGNATSYKGLLIQAGLNDQTEANTSTLLQFNDGDGDVVGSITFGSSQTDYNTTSDARLKENIVDTSLGLDDLMKIKVRDFSFKGDKNGKTTHGLIAQELYDSYPQAVTVPADDSSYYMVDYSKLTPLLIKSVQELSNKLSEGGSFVASNIQVGALNVNDLTIKGVGNVYTLVSTNIRAGSIIASEVTVNTTLKVADIFTNSIVANVVKAGEITVESLQGSTLKAGSLITENIKAGAIAVDQFVSESVVAQSGKFIDFVAENVTTGALATKEFTTDSATAFTASIDNLLIKTGLVSPSIRTAVISPIDGKDLTVRLESGDDSRFKIEDSEGKEVASIDSTGKVTSDRLKVTNDAIVGGTLYADKIVANTLPENPKITEIEKLLRDVEGNQKFLYEIAEKTNLSVESVEGGVLSDLSMAELYVTSHAAINNLSVSDTISFSDMIIESSNLKNSVSSINTLSAPLSLQSLALAPIELMAGKIKVDTTGNVEFLGNVNIAGNLNVEGKSRLQTLSTEKLIIASQGENLQGETFESTIETNASAGKALISSGESEIVIKNSGVTDNSLVYVTATSPTNNQVLFVKSKEIGKFSVGFIDPVEEEVSFNWWIIDVQQ